MNPASKLIFIISQPRSGSTLTQKLLSNNELVDTASEPWILLPYLSVFREDLIHAEYNTKVAKDGIIDYLEKKGLTNQYKELLKDFLLSLYPISTGKKYFVDKTPRYYEIIDEIYDLFPEAKFLILKRSPFSSLYSMLETWSGFKTDFDSLSTFYRDFLFAPQKIQQFAMKHKSTKNIFEVKYEDIVQNPAEATKLIYEWANLSYSDEVLDIGKNEKVKGIYGDDVYKKESANNVQSDKNSDWEQKIMMDKKLRLFFAEYASFLGESFINEYGYNKPALKTEGGLFTKSDFNKLLEKIKLK